MSDSLRTFKDIFEKPVDTSNGSICPTKIIIPMIQRDFAQGRDSVEIKRIRDRFLDALHKAVIDKPIKLDFIYGDLSSTGVLTPLDGQQRLTTLFLLHWYAAKKESLPLSETTCLEKFSYETRPDSRDFCEYLTKYQPTFESYESLSAEIEDQSWFTLSWKRDPTIKSMLIMLDAIANKFSDIKNLWSKLTGGAISFYFLAIENMGLTDELYITMNSRGKPLTDFEHFKAEFKHKLDEIDAAKSNEIILNIDTKWTHMLWRYRDENNLIDGGFLKYFRYICDVIRYRSGGTPRGKNNDEFALLEEFFSVNSDNVRENIAFLENCFNCWCDINIGKFFRYRVSLGDRTKRDKNKHLRGKIIVYCDNINFFESCLKVYGEMKDGRTRRFSLGEMIILYAFQTYLINRANISDWDFRRRLRIVNNLVNNSNDEISDSEHRHGGGNRIPSILRQVDSIIIHGKILDDIDPNFNEYQLKEERLKLEWTANNPDESELLYELEDHYLLYGQVGFLLDKGRFDTTLFRKFIDLFKCDYDLIDCALLARQGKYFQRIGGYYQLGSTNPQSWQNLFHYSSYKNFFEDSRYLIIEFLKNCDTPNFNDEYLHYLIQDYLIYCEDKQACDWIYYYVKYKEFRPGRYGKYYWADFDKHEYIFDAMWTPKYWSTNAYRPFLKAAVNADIFKKHYNAMKFALVFGNYQIICADDGYVLKNNDGVVDAIHIEQRGGTDTVDRIEVFKQKFNIWQEKIYKGG